jgi:flagellar biosynthesis protein FlhG
VLRGAGSALDAGYRIVTAVAPRTIIPVAGGKGGVGKTFVTASLAAALARHGHATIVVDLDLGNSNLHNFLGLENRYAGIGEYLRGVAQKPLEALLVQTEIPRLRFLPGDGRMPFMANLTYNQKRVLLRELRRLEAEYVVIDLSAGTTFNTLDLFSISDSGIVVTTPERPAVVSMLVFLKNLVLRAVDQELRKDSSLLDLLNEIAVQRMGDELFTMEVFAGRLMRANPGAYDAVRVLLRRIRPRIVYNMMERREDLEIFASLDRTLEEILGIACDHVGLIPQDDSVRLALREPRGALVGRVSRRTADAIDRLAVRVVRYWREPIHGSAELLTTYGRTVLSPQGATLQDAPPPGDRQAQ